MVTDKPRETCRCGHSRFEVRSCHCTFAPVRYKSRCLKSVWVPSYTSTIVRNDTYVREPRWATRQSGFGSQPEPPSGCASGFADPDPPSDSSSRFAPQQESLLNPLHLRGYLWSSCDMRVFADRHAYSWPCFAKITSQKRRHPSEKPSR